MKAEKVRKGNKRDYIQILLSFSKKIKYDHVTSFAAHAALFILMSLFPMLMYVISMISYFSVDNVVFSTFWMDLFPESLQQFMEELLIEASSGTSSLFQSFTMIVTLVCASKGVYAIIIGMNAVYGRRETRNFIMVNILAVVYVVAFFCILGLSMILIVLGDKIFNWLLKFAPFLSDFESTFGIGKYICTLIIFIVILLFVYMNMPSRKSKIRYEIVGAVFSGVSWLIFSMAFSYYIDHFGNYSYTYGSLATVVIFILWLYTSMYIIFVGAEINVVVRTYMEYGYNYKKAYDYYNEEYEGDLKNDGDLLIRLAHKHENRGRENL